MHDEILDTVPFTTVPGDCTDQPATPVHTWVICPLHFDARVDLGSGNDHVSFDGTHADCFDGYAVNLGDGANTVNLPTCTAIAPATVMSGSGQDTLTEGTQTATLSSGGGDDSVYAGRGNDVIDGGEGNDRLFGGDGNDQVEGATGADTVDDAQANGPLTPARAHGFVDSRHGL